jgi:hypothetical protein
MERVIFDPTNFFSFIFKFPLKNLLFKIWFLKV